MLKHKKLNNLLKYSEIKDMLEVKMKYFQMKRNIFRKRSKVEEYKLPFYSRM